MTITVGVFEAKTRLSELLDSVQGGEEVVITKRGQPIACLRRVDNPVERAQQALDALRAIGTRARPGTESIRELIEEGRRYP
ncbi:MAG: type II toxin-antitoxin system Phd/YefM family antitoxin [Actinomycetales bacterium]|jgi:prevent-host-death family protein